MADRGPRANSAHDDEMSKKVVLVDRLDNVEYTYAGSQYLFEELEVNCCVLKYSYGVLEMIVASKAIPYITER